MSILDVIHRTIYEFIDDLEDEVMSDKDKLLLEVNKAICNNLKALKLTDTEQRIFLAAMGREENACKKVEEDLMVVCHSEEVGEDLVAVCHSIKRKVKGALWG